MITDYLSVKDIEPDAHALGDALADGVNNYGESFTDAIQMAFVRGQKGIDRT